MIALAVDFQGFTSNDPCRACQANGETSFYSRYPNFLAAAAYGFIFHLLAQNILSD